MYRDLCNQTLGRANAVIRPAPNPLSRERTPGHSLLKSAVGPGAFCGTPWPSLSVSCAAPVTLTKLTGRRPVGCLDEAGEDSR